MALIAKAVSSISNVDRRFTGAKINRRLDDRDFVLKEALKNVEEKSNDVYPAITKLEGGLALLSVGGGAMTGKDITGVNFIGDTTKSSGSTEDSTGEILLDAVLPGAQTITVTITDTGVALAVTASVPAGTVTVVHGMGGPSTAAAIVAAINAHAEAKFMVNASVTTGGFIDADESVAVDGGTGDLMTLSIGADSLDGDDAGKGVTDVSDTVVTIDYDPSALSVGEGYVLMLRVDGSLCQPLLLTAVA
jgi:hypothetical protein